MAKAIPAISTLADQEERENKEELKAWSWIKPKQLHNHNFYRRLVAEEGRYRRTNRFYRAEKDSRANRDNSHSCGMLPARLHTCTKESAWLSPNFLRRYRIPQCLSFLECPYSRIQSSSLMHKEHPYSIYLKIRQYENWHLLNHKQLHTRRRLAEESETDQEWRQRSSRDQNILSTIPQRAQRGQQSKAGYQDCGRSYHPFPAGFSHIFLLLFPAPKLKPQLCKLHEPGRIIPKMHMTAPYQRLPCKWLMT